MTPDEQVDWYRRRVKALEDLLSCYRWDKRPSERLFTELERTGRRIDHDGVWRDEKAPE